MAYTAAVITVSDTGAAGLRQDTSGPALEEILKKEGWDVVHTAVIPDEPEEIKAQLIACADERKVNLVLTTGGTGFSPRDVTPEATLAVLERRTPGICEAMRAESMRITPKGCLSRSESGIRGSTLIVNLPGSRKAAVENILTILGALQHGVEILLSAGSANCGEAEAQKLPLPSMDAWLRQAKSDPSASRCGMYLTHNGTVRKSAKARVRQGDDTAPDVAGMFFDYDSKKVEDAVAKTYKMQGVYYIRVWLNRGELAIGDDIMYVLIGGDTRTHVTDAMQSLLSELKTNCVTETERVVL